MERCNTEDLRTEESETNSKYRSSQLYDRKETNMEERLIHDDDCKVVYTPLNCWSDFNKSRAIKLLEEGYWVRFCSSWVGATPKKQVEQDGIEWLKSKYGDTLQIVERKYYGHICCRLR